MKRDMVMVRVGGALHPDGDESWEAFEKLVQHHKYRVSVHKSRNPDFLRRYWSMASLVAQNCKDFDDRESADHYARASIPWMRERYIARDGEVVLHLKSIALDEMEEEEFDRFYNAACDLWAEKIGMDPEELMREHIERLRQARRAPTGQLLPKTGRFA